MIGTKRNWICVFVTFLLGTSFFLGCGKKEEDSKPVKRIAKPADIISVKLKDGTNVKIDTVQFGIKAFPSGDILSYECVADQRRLMDRLGKPMVQAVYKHQMYIETTGSVDSLIQFFFQKTPYVVNRRKYGNSDSYVRLVSTKDINKVRDLEDPYTIIDLKVVYPKVKPKEDIHGLDRVPAVQGVSPEENKISYLKSKIKQHEDSLLSPETTIPERRKIHEDIAALKVEISDIEDRVESSKQKRKDLDKEKRSIETKKVPKKPLYVKIKILTYSYREE